MLYSAIVGIIIQYSAKGFSVLIVPMLVSVFLLWIPGLAVGSRRLHDIGLSGWWQLLLLPFLMPAVILTYPESLNEESFWPFIVLAIGFLGMAFLIGAWILKPKLAVNRYGTNPLVSAPKIDISAGSKASDKQE